MLVLEETELLPLLGARAGDPEAWRTLFERFRLPLFSYLTQLTGDQEASLDLIQETFLSATRFITTLRSDDKFAGWLFGIARQKVIQTWRKKRLPMISLDETTQDESLFESSTPSPSEFLILEENETNFWDALNGLSVVHKEVIVLFFLEEFSLEEIAEITGTSVGTTKSRLFYARKNFKEFYEKH